MATTAQMTPADALRDLIARGVAAYQASLPDYARDETPVVILPDHALADVEPARPNNLGIVDEDRQRELCLSCHLADCVGVENAACPIRIEQCRIWREQRRLKQWPN